MKGKDFLNQAGYGPGTNYTTNTVAGLCESFGKLAVQLEKEKYTIKSRVEGAMVALGVGVDPITWRDGSLQEECVLKFRGWSRMSDDLQDSLKVVLRELKIEEEWMDDDDGDDGEGRTITRTLYSYRITKKK